MSLFGEIKMNIWKCNLKPVDVQKCLREGFWRDVLFVWVHYNNANPKAKEEFQMQWLWYNSHNQIGKKPTFLQKAYSAGLETVEQLFNLEGGLIEMEICTKMFDLTVLEWNSIVSAIPKGWKKSLGETLSISIKPSYKCKQIKDQMKEVALIYRNIAENYVFLNNFTEKWNQEFEIEFDEFYSALRNINSVTNQVKLRSFQYRMLYRALILNDKLYKWNITQTSLCMWCQEYVENVRHFYWECETIQNMWQWLIDTCKKLDPEVELTLTYKNIILNSLSKKPSHVANFLLLVYKQYVYAARCKKTQLSKHEIDAKIQIIKQYELYYATFQNKIQKHIEKWCIIRNNKMVHNASGMSDEYVQKYTNEMSTCT